MIKKSYIFIIFLLSSPVVIMAQDCGSKLTEATRAYYNGNLREVEPLLTECINGKEMDKYQKVESLKLLVNTFLVLREDEKADQYMNQLLSLDPEFKVRSGDLIEFQKLYDTYRIQTKYNVGLISGFTQPDYVILRYQSYASETIEPEDYTEETGLILGISGDAHIWNGFFARTSIIYMTSGFRQEEIILNYQRVATEEKEVRINIPVEIQYIYDRWKWKPFVSGGMSMHYLISSTAKIDHVPIEPEVPSGFLGIPVSDRNYDLTDQRERLTWNWLLSAGVQYKLNQWTLEARGTFEYGLNNLVKEDQRYADQVLLDEFAYVPDDYKMNNLRFTISVFRTFSKPVKK